MATVKYMDANGTSPGYGTLTSTWNNLFNINGRPMIGNSIGTSVTTYNLIASDILSFGSPSLASTTPGVLTIVTAITRNTNGLISQNLGGGTQTVAGTDSTSFLSLTLSGSTGIPSIDTKTDGNILISARMTGGDSWFKTGPSTLTLTGDNGLMTANISIDQGKVAIGRSNALGTGLVTLNNSTLTSNSGIGYDTTNAITLNGTCTIGDASTGYLSFAGVPTIGSATNLTLNADLYLSGNLAGSSALTKSGNNTLILLGSGVSGYSGAVNISGGTIRIATFNSGTPNQLNSASSITVGTGFGLQICGNTAYTFPQAISGGGELYVRNTNASGITFNNFSGFTGSPRIYADPVEGGVTQQKISLTNSNQMSFGVFYYLIGSGLTQDITQTLAYTGNSVASHGSIFVINAFNVNRRINAVFENSSSNNSTVTLTSTVQNYATSAVSSSTYRLAATAGNIIHSGSIQETSTGTLNFNKTGNYDATLVVANTHKGTNTISSGKLTINDKLSLGTGAVILSGSLQCTDNSSAIIASVGSFTAAGASARLILG